MVRDLELGDLLLASISGGVRGNVRSAALGMDVLAAGFAHVQIVETVDDFIRVDLSLLEFWVECRLGMEG
jgi:hypothetical protein